MRRTKLTNIDVGTKLRTYQIHADVKEEKRELIEQLKTMMPVQQESHVAVMKKLIHQSVVELLTRHKLQWIVLIALLYFGFSASLHIKDERIFSLFLSPIPLFYLGWHVIKTNDDGMRELEATYKYNFQQLLFARVVSLFALSTAAYTGVFGSVLLFHSSLPLVQVFLLIVQGLTPILFIYALFLKMSIQYRGRSSWSTLFLIWSCLTMLSIYMDESIFFFHLKSVSYILLNIGLIVLIMYQWIKIWRMERISYESY